MAAVPLLVPTSGRSDGPSITVLVESLAPARGYAMEVAPSLTVAALKERYLVLARREMEQPEAGSGGCACPFHTAVHAIGQSYLWLRDEIACDPLWSSPSHWQCGSCQCQNLHGRTKCVVCALCLGIPSTPTRASL